jgi:hypothetical protein
MKRSNLERSLLKRGTSAGPVTEAMIDWCKKSMDEAVAREEAAEGKKIKRFDGDWVDFLGLSRRYGR